MFPCSGSDAFQELVERRERGFGLREEHLALVAASFPLVRKVQGSTVLASLRQLSSVEGNSPLRTLDLSLIHVADLGISEAVLHLIQRVSLQSRGSGSELCRSPLLSLRGI